jgi:hypothetical protein
LVLTPVWPVEPAGRERRAISKAGARIVNSHLVGPPDVPFGSIATGQFNEGSGLCPLCAVSDRNVALLQTQLFAINAGHLGSRLIALRWLSPGEAHDNRLCSVLLNELSPRTMLLADQGYDADWIRALASEQGAWANIPPKRNRKEANLLQPISLPCAKLG